MREYEDNIIISLSAIAMGMSREVSELSKISELTGSVALDRLSAEAVRFVRSKGILVDRVCRCEGIGSERVVRTREWIGLCK